jgi:hypothetical protein
MDTEWRNWKFQQKLECWRLFFCCVFCHEVGFLKNDPHQMTYRKDSTQLDRLTPTTSLDKRGMYISYMFLQIHNFPSCFSIPIGYEDTTKHMYLKSDGPHLVFESRIG